MESSANPANPANFEPFPWNSLLETGIARIDAQHRVLVGLLNRLAQRQVLGETEQDINALLTELANYVNYHFRTEEAIWCADLVGDVWLKEHCQTHQAFFAQIDKLRVRKGNFQTQVDKLFDYLTRWLIDHILGDDKRMALAVLAVRSGMTPGAAHQHALTQHLNTTSILVQTVLGMYRTATRQAQALLQEKHAREKAETTLHHTQDRWRFLLADTHAAHGQVSPLEQTLRAVIDYVPAGLVVADAYDQHFVFANPWFCQMIGYSLDEVLSLSPSDIHPPDSVPAVKADFDVNDVGVAKDALVIAVRRKDGSLFMANIERVPVSLYGQTSVLAVFTDVTERYHAQHKLETERLRLQNAIDAALAGTWEWDIASNTILINDRAATQLGLDAQQVSQISGETYLS